MTLALLMLTAAVFGVLVNRWWAIAIAGILAAGVTALVASTWGLDSPFITTGVLAAAATTLGLVLRRRLLGAAARRA